MDIKICKSTELSESQWEAYTLGFNEVFHRDFTTEYFKKKYFNAYLGYSWHAILISDEEDVVGGVTVIPCYYNKSDERFINGLAVDVFIREAYREDPLMLRRMYKKLRTKLEAEGMVSVVAVPNATAYPYWKIVVKWKDVGCLNYWMLPVMLGNILGKKGLTRHVLNILSVLYCKAVRVCTSLLSFVKSKGEHYVYSICEDDPYYIGKFSTSDYKKVDEDGIHYIYKLDDEDGVRTAYLLRAEENGLSSFRAIRLALNDILKNKIDIVLYVGKLDFFQTIFIKVPRKFEPKLLPLTCDLIAKDEKYKDMFDFANWDFGLKNYDVR